MSNERPLNDEILYAIGTVLNDGFMGYNDRCEPDPGHQLQRQSDDGVPADWIRAYLLPIPAQPTFDGQFKTALYELRKKRGFITVQDGEPFDREFAFLFQRPDGRAVHSHHLPGHTVIRIGRLKPGTLEVLPEESRMTTHRPQFLDLTQAGWDEFNRRFTAVTFQRSIDRARAEVASFMDDAGNAARPEIEVPYRLTSAAFAIAIEIAKAARFDDALTPVQLVYGYGRLAAFLDRLDPLLRTPGMWDRWPTTPGTTFAQFSGASALVVAAQFSEAIRTAVLVSLGYSITHGKFPRPIRDWVVSEPGADPAIAEWLSRAVEHLRTRTVPPADKWSGWEMDRDFGRLLTLLDDEYRRAHELASRNSRAGTKRGRSPIAKGLPDAKGYVVRPADPSAYVPANTLLAEHIPDGLMVTQKSLPAILADYSSNRIRWTRPPGRDGAPRPNRRNIHLTDWLSYIARCQRTLQQSDPTPTQIADRAAGIRNRKAAGK